MGSRKRTVVGQRGFHLGCGSSITIIHSFSLGLSVECVPCARWWLVNETTDVNITKSPPCGRWLLAGQTEGHGDEESGRGRELRKTQAARLGREAGKGPSEGRRVSRQLQGAGGTMTGRFLQRRWQPTWGMEGSFQNRGAGAQLSGAEGTSG